MKEDSETENTKKDDKQKSRGSRAHKFFDKLDFVQIDSDSEGQGKKVDSKDSKDENDSKSGDKEKDSHTFKTMSNLLGPEKIKKIKSEKNKILMIIGIIAGILLIIMGALMTMTGSAEKVADNVIFGEKEVFSVFLVLIGVLLIAISLAYHFIGKSFFNRIDKEIESYNKETSEKNNIKKDNINRNNR